MAGSTAKKRRLKKTIQLSDDEEDAPQSGQAPTESAGSTMAPEYMRKKVIDLISSAATEEELEKEFFGHAAGDAGRVI